MPLSPDIDVDAELMEASFVYHFPGRFLRRDSVSESFVPHGTEHASGSSILNANNRLRDGV